MMRAMLIAMLVAGCTDDATTPGPDAGATIDAASDAPNVCAAMFAQLMPRPDLGACEIPWEPGLPASCVTGSTMQTATCTDLYANPGGAIGVWVQNDAGLCKFVTCSTTPTGL